MRTSTIALVLLAGFAATACDADESSSTELPNDTMQGGKTDEIGVARSLACRSESGMLFDIQVGPETAVTVTSMVEDEDADAKELTVKDHKFEEDPDGTPRYEFDLGSGEDAIEIKIGGVGLNFSTFFRGPLKHQGKKDEEIICYDAEAAATERAETVRQPEFDCISPDTEFVFALQIDDAAEQDGTVFFTRDIFTQQHTLPAKYRRLLDISGKPKHGFVFGFGDLEAGVIDELERIEIVESSRKFATGTVSFEGEAGLVCYKYPSE